METYRKVATLSSLAIRKAAEMEAKFTNTYVVAGLHAGCGGPVISNPFGVSCCSWCGDLRPRMATPNYRAGLDGGTCLALAVEGKSLRASSPKPSSADSPATQGGTR